jgi:hypothetical protein
MSTTSEAAHQSARAHKDTCPAYLSMAACCEQRKDSTRQPQQAPLLDAVPKPPLPAQPSLRTGTYSVDLHRPRQAFDELRPLQAARLWSAALYGCIA